MNHVDEGTIHAWLDGALDAAQAREIEAHVAGCAACSAAVAEARGLIAGASRILGALDEVPAGVIPGAAARTAAASPPIKAPAAPARTAARLKPRGQWRVARWASGIAAVLVGAVVLSTAHMTRRSMEMARPTAGAVDSVVATSAPRQEAARGAESLVQPAAPPATVPAPQRTVRPTSVASAPGNAATKAVGAATGAVRETKARDVASAKFEEVTVTGAAPERARSAGVQVTTMDSTRVRRLGDQPLALSEVVVTSVPANAATMQSDVDVQRFAGCYRFEPPVAIAQQRTPTAGAAANTERRARAAAPAQAPAPAAAADRADFSGRGAVPLVRLDTTLVAGQRRAVRIPSDSVVGFWLAAHDSVRIDLGSRGAVTLSRLQRVACP